jgi:hypothetical protein
MSELGHPAAFLVALGRLIETSSADEGPTEARVQAISDLMAALTNLLREHTFPSFAFRQGEVEYEGELLSELRNWEWSLQLQQGGIERLDITPGTTREDLEGFVEEVVARLYLREGGASARELHGQSGVRFGELDIAEAGVGGEAAIPSLELSLDAETEAVSWLNGQVAEHGVVPAGEAATVVQLLSIAMHSERDIVVPLVQLKSVDQYTTTYRASRWPSPSTWTTARPMFGRSAKRRSCTTWARRTFPWRSSTRRGN